MLMRMTLHHKLLLKVMKNRRGFEVTEVVDVLKTIKRTVKERRMEIYKEEKRRVKREQKTAKDLKPALEDG